MGNLIRTLFVVFSALISTMSPVLAADYARDIPYQKLESIYGVNVGDKRQVVFRDDVTWNSIFYKESYGVYGPPPKINFRENMVAGIFLGGYPVGRKYEIPILSVKENVRNKKIVISYKVPKVDPPEGISLPSFTTLYTLVVIPASGKNVEFVEVKEE
ncbi:hypothetical protein [Paucimonas lemoignei]|uniref:hypothetical protein n=1 Tax=Paucimonas lemoignei TaxID=29443 RepID=UPI00104B6A2F|nr:hypothetical protein [Paucimonas lemoignei]